MLGQSQGRGYASPESSVPALNVLSTAQNCTNSVRSNGGSPLTPVAAPGSWRTRATFDECPMCGKEPVEPVRVDGQMACRACTGSCLVCGAACVHGDEACMECLRAAWAVPA